MITETPKKWYILQNAFSEFRKGVFSLLPLTSQIQMASLLYAKQNLQGGGGGESGFKWISFNLGKHSLFVFEITRLL